MTSTFKQAFLALLPDSQTAINALFSYWNSDPQYSQVRENVEAETALSISDFVNLLTHVARETQGGTVAAEAWLLACRASKLRGMPLAGGAVPAVLGRAKTVDDHAASVARASNGAITKDEARRLILKYASTPLSPAFERLMRSTFLGNFLVWATFCQTAPASNPFDHIPATHGALRTALGLGHITSHESLLVLVWDHASCGSPRLHRPTVADAELYPFYRPCLDPALGWGLTCPLTPNAHGVSEQPEVIFAATTSEGLLLPYRIYI